MTMPDHSVGFLGRRSVAIGAVLLMAAWLGLQLLDRRSDYEYIAAL